MQEEGCPDINIICERITVGGLPTRFEDQTRLPMGVSVNSTSYSAKLLQVGTQQAHHLRLICSERVKMQTRLPMGVSVNSTSLLRQAAAGLCCLDISCAAALECLVTHKCGCQWA